MPWRPIDEFLAAVERRQLNEATPTERERAARQLNRGSVAKVNRR